MTTAAIKPNTYSMTSFESFAGSSLTQSRRYSCWARGQVHYILGSNPKQYSYMVGYGDNFPLQVHHRGASCPNVPTVCNYDNFNLNQANPHVIYGAMVGGKLCAPGSCERD